MAGKRLLQSRALGANSSPSHPEIRPEFKGEKKNKVPFQPKNFLMSQSSHRWLTNLYFIIREKEYLERIRPTPGSHKVTQYGCKSQTAKNVISQIKEKCT